MTSARRSAIDTGSSSNNARGRAMRVRPTFAGDPGYELSFCPTGSGGGVDPSCGRSSGGGGGIDNPTPMPKLSHTEKQQVIATLDGWRAEYVAKGSDARLPFQYIEDTNPKMFDKLSEVLDHAQQQYAIDHATKHPGTGTAQEYIDNSQGYHDEQSDVVDKALQLLK